MASARGLAKRSVVKLKDVAELAGCSVATASRVINGNPKVGTDEKERVLTAAAQLGYVPNNSARALRSLKTRLVGAIIPTLDHAIYAKMVDGLQDRLAQNGVSVIINTSFFDLDLELTQARLLVGRGVEAIVLVGNQHRPETLSYLASAGVARVFTYTATSDGGDAAVGFDNRSAGALAASYLVGLGHRSLAMIAGVTRNNDRAAERRDGFLDELERHGIERDGVIVLEAPYRIEDGQTTMQSLMQTHPRPTAVFCGSDILAAGAVKYCTTVGVTIPDEVSVIGFDNLDLAQLVTPELTTLDVPAREMGELAADVILARNDDTTQKTVRELRTRLIVRKSTGPAPAR